jgi:hypothetical protein
VTQEAARVVIDAVQTDLGLPVVGMPTVRIAFGTEMKPVASSVSQAPAAAPAFQAEPPSSQAETVEPQFESTQPEAAAPRKRRRRRRGRSRRLRHRRRVNRPTLKTAPATKNNSRRTGAPPLLS